MQVQVPVHAHVQLQVQLQVYAQAQVHAVTGTDGGFSATIQCKRGRWFINHVLQFVLLKQALQHASVELLANVSIVPLLFPPATLQHDPVGETGW